MMMEHAWVDDSSSHLLSFILQLEDCGRIMHQRSELPFVTSRQRGSCHTKHHNTGQRGLVDSCSSKRRTELPFLSLSPVHPVAPQRLSHHSFQDSFYVSNTGLRKTRSTYLHVPKIAGGGGYTITVPGCISLDSNLKLVVRPLPCDASGMFTATPSHTL